MKDFVIIGSGLFGTTFAQQCLEHGKTCIIFEKADHIAGHVYSKKIEDIDVHQYWASHTQYR